MEEIVKITRADTSLVEPNRLLMEQYKTIAVLSITMMQSSKTDKVGEGREIEFEGRIYGVYRMSSTRGSTGDIINLSLLDKRSIV